MDFTKLLLSILRAVSGVPGPRKFKTPREWIESMAGAGVRRPSLRSPAGGLRYDQLQRNQARTRLTARREAMRRRRRALKQAQKQECKA